jgi:hypothetical protein
MGRWIDDEIRKKEQQQLEAARERERREAERAARQQEQLRSENERRRHAHQTASDGLAKYAREYDLEGLLPDYNRSVFGGYGRILKEDKPPQWNNYDDSVKIERYIGIVYEYQGKVTRYVWKRLPVYHEGHNYGYDADAPSHWSINEVEVPAGFDSKRFIDGLVFRLSSSGYVSAADFHGLDARHDPLHHYDTNANIWEHGTGRSFIRDFIVKSTLSRRQNSWVHPDLPRVQQRRVEEEARARTESLKREVDRYNSGRSWFDRIRF